MTTEKQFEANRKNAERSTGPRTEHGKRRSRRNAFRHGLTAETVIEALEDRADYQAFASRINADYRPRSNFELELVARLVSHLWRLRRAVAIESGLFAIQAEVVQKRHADERRDRNKLSPFYALIPALIPIMQDRCPGPSEPDGQRTPSHMARSFARVSCDGDAFERLGRYEMRLWRQAVQTILLLNAINRDAKNYANDQYFGLRNMPSKGRRVLWPPFVTSD